MFIYSFNEFVKGMSAVQVLLTASVQWTGKKWSIEANKGGGEKRKGS